MGESIRIKQGDCLINLCSAIGLHWEDVWSHPENQDLRTKRKKLNILKPDDMVFIPDKEIKEHPCSTEQRHIFVVQTNKVQFTLTLKNLGKPRANQKYVLKVSGQADREGTTDDQGTLNEMIPAEARSGTLLIGDDQHRFDLVFGSIDPIEEISGVQTRLNNLGFYYGAIDDQMNPETTTAIAEFQRRYELPGEGEINDETRQKLVEAHGS